MKCPRCNFVAANSKDACPRCHQDLRPLKKELGLVPNKKLTSFTKTTTPSQTLNPSLQPNIAPKQTTTSTSLENSNLSLSPSKPKAQTNTNVSKAQSHSEPHSKQKLNSASLDTLPTIESDEVIPIDDSLFSTNEGLELSTKPKHVLDTFEDVNFDTALDEPLFRLESVQPIALPEDLKKSLDFEAPLEEDTTLETSNQASTQSISKTNAINEDVSELTLSFESDTPSNQTSKDITPGNFSLSFETAVDTSIKKSAPAFDNSKVFKANEKEATSEDDFALNLELSNEHNPIKPLRSETIQEIDALFNLSMSLQQQLADTIDATKKVAEKEFEPIVEVTPEFNANENTLEDELATLLLEEKVICETLSNARVEPLVEVNSTRDRILEVFNSNLAYEIGILIDYERKLHPVDLKVLKPALEPALAEDIIYEVDLPTASQSNPAIIAQKPEKALISATAYRDRHYEIDNSDLLKAFSDVEEEIKLNSHSEETESKEQNLEPVLPQHCNLLQRYFACVIDTMAIITVGTLFSLALFLPELRSQLLAFEMPTAIELFKNSFVILSCCYFIWMISFTILNVEGLQTVGGKYFGIVTVDETFELLTLNEAMLRALSLNATLLTFGLGNLFVLGQKRQALHDKIARTCVINEIIMDLPDQSPAFVNRIHKIDELN